ncbi:helix-turn-helix domain-containing protein [Streptomyces sp. NPDC050617]|uniref:MmyB family transcriptional regulator n=1 Tax=Streptomyces sp. NPDC050617 TaxID=3154628 RepID=UPI003446A94C
MGSVTELGEFLRSRRSRITPQQVGLPPSAGHRRTAGLRREEVAILAGVSVEYYRRLEQGKQCRPSPSVLDAIATVLKLTDDEHRHLTELSQDSTPPLSGQNPPRRASRQVRPEVRRVLDMVFPYPACVLSRSSDLLAANVPGLRLLPGIEDWPEEQRNTARYTFLHPAAPLLYADWDGVARGVVAHLRAADAVHPEAPELRELIEELARHSDAFVDLWQHYDVRTRTNGRKVYRHPDAGRLELTYEAFDVARSEGQRLVVYQAPPGSPHHDALLRLATPPATEPAPVRESASVFEAAPATEPASAREPDPAPHSAPARSAERHVTSR